MVHIQKFGLSGKVNRILGVRVTGSLLARTFLGSALIWLSACSGGAEEPISSAPQGWAIQAFDFGAPDLRGEIALPSNAMLQAVRYQPRQPNTAGHSTVVGKVEPSGTVPADVTVMAFDLEYPAAALRVCAYEAQAIGLDVVSQSASDDLSSASLRSVRGRDGKVEQVAFTRCLTRGTKLLAFHFAAAPDSADENATVKTGKEIEAFARTMFRHMTFADGEPLSHWQGMTEVPLKLGRRTSTLKTSPDWTVVINDFNGTTPAELHMVRKRESQDAGLLWLGVFDAPDAFDMARDGQTLLNAFIAKQSPGFGDPKLRSSEHLAPPQGVNGEKRRFLFEIPSKSGGEASDLVAAVAHNGDKLYAVAWWSPSISGSSRERFMARLPGMTAFDLAQEAMTSLTSER